jgi:hypothetical protein
LHIHSTWVLSMDKSGGATFNLAVSPNWISVIAGADAQYVYWSGQDAAFRVSKSTGALTKLYDVQNLSLPTVGDRFAGMALDDTAIYWATGLNDAPDLVAPHYWLSIG